MSNKTKSVKFNIVMNVLLTMSTFIFPLITFPYVSRILSPAGIGKVSFAISLVSYFSLFAQLGIPTYGIKACAKVRDDKQELTKVTQELLLINLFMSALVYVVFAIVLIKVPKLQNDKIIYIIISSVILLNAIGVEWLYKALEEYTYITVRSIIFKVVALIAMFLTIHQEDDYIMYGIISILASSASNIFNFFYVHHYIPLRPVGNYDFKRHFRPILLFFAMSCATTIYGHLDTVMLGFIATDADVGYYSAAIKIKSILVSVVTSLGAVLLPRTTYYIQNGFRKEFQTIAEKAINFVFLVSIPMMVYFMLFAKQGIFFLSGKNYAGAIVPMIVIMPTLLLIGITNILGVQIMTPLNLEKKVLLSEVTGAVVNLVLNFIFIPKFQATGAAIGTVFAELSVFIVQFFSVRKEILGAFKLNYLRIIIGTFLGVSCSVWILLLNLGDFTTLLISSALFFGVYGAFMLLCREPFVMEMLDMFLTILKKMGKKR